jgi:beta-lactamase class C
VALWNSDTWQPGGLEFEVMDMLYHLQFRDWLELNKNAAQSIAAADSEPDSGGPS